MKRVLVMVFLAGLLVLNVAQEAKKVDVTGKWTMTITTPRGEFNREIEFIQKGEKLTVITENRQGDEIKAEGTVKGNKISWEVNMETQRGSFTIKYEGTIDGDSMSGEASFGDRSMEWSAERAKEK